MARLLRKSESSLGGEPPPGNALILESNPVDSFLVTLRSAGKLDYKRYLGSPLRYAGGKSLAVGYILERMPKNISRLVCPFIGGGSVEVACAREIGLEVVGYDVFDILVNFWQVQLAKPQDLYSLLKEFSPDRDTFKQVKERLYLHWIGEATLDSDDLASHYYFNSNTSYGPHFLGWPSDIYLENSRYDKMLRKVRDFRAPGLTVECAGFEESMTRHGSDFLYCDPPYYLEDGKTFTGMYPHRNFPVHHVGFRHDLLRDILLEHEGGFILSYNDCETIRKWYSGFNMFSPSWQYTFGQGDTRIGDNRIQSNGSSHIKKSHELLIWRNPTDD